MKKICTHPSCNEIVEGGGCRCPQHERVHQKSDLEHHFDGKGRRIYGTARWKRLRLQKLSINPLCQKCEAIGVVKEATMVDHIKEIADGGEAYNIHNLQSLCYKCHARKTHQEKIKRAGSKVKSIDDY